MRAGGTISPKGKARAISKRIGSGRQADGSASSLLSTVVEGLNEIVHAIYLAQNYPNNSNRINAGPSCFFLLTLRVQACALWPPKLSRRISSNCGLPRCSCRLPGNPHGMRGSVVMSSFYLGEPRGDLSPLVPGFWPDCGTLPTCLCDS